MGRWGSLSVVAAVNQLCSSRHRGWGTELLGLPQPRPPSQVPGVMDTRWLPAIYWALGQRAWRTQPSHTLPACAQKHLSWACGRCDMVTPGPRTGSRLQHALVCVDSCLQLCLPSHAPFLEQPCHRPVCTAQVRGRCREAAKQMIGTQCDVCAIYFFKRSWGYYTWHGNQHKYCANVTCSQVSRGACLPQCRWRAHYPPPGSGFLGGPPRLCAGRPHAWPRSTRVCLSPQPRSLRGQNIGDTQGLPREAVCFQRGSIYQVQ